MAGVDDEGRNMAADDNGLAERYEAGRELTLRAGALAAEYASRISELDVRWKGAQDVVTEADLEVELLIKRGLADFATARRSTWNRSFRRLPSKLPRVRLTRQRPALREKIDMA